MVRDIDKNSRNTPGCFINCKPEVESDSEVAVHTTSEGDIINQPSHGGICGRQ